jgi:RNA polymerase sigma-70 factor (ECF subfamily)
VEERTDEQLIADFQKGDEEALETLRARFGGQIMAMLYRMVEDWHTAEDLLQDVWVRLIMRKNLFHEGRRLRPWLFAVAANIARDWIRGQRRRPTVSLHNTIDEDDEATFLKFFASNLKDSSDAREANEFIQEAVNSLPEVLRDTVVLNFLEGMDYAQTAEILAVPVGTVKSRIHSGRKSLKKICLELVGE